MIVNFLGKPLHLNLENKIFGLSNSNGSGNGLSMKHVQKINIIILLAKFAIVKAKAQKSTNFVLYFEEEIHFRKILPWMHKHFYIWEQYVVLLVS